jgi:hypothetical protein
VVEYHINFVDTKYDDIQQRIDVDFCKVERSTDLDEFGETVETAIFELIEKKVYFKSKYLTEEEIIKFLDMELNNV